jgi:putative FmdB family regulatory protein
MPIYEYECLGCGQRFEKLERSTKSPLETTCPRCGGREVRRLPSVFGVQTSGSTGGPVCPTCVPRR